MKLKQKYESIMKKISDRLRDLLHVNKINGKGLADKWGVSDSYVSQIKNDQASITTDKCLSMAKELGIKPEIILLEMLHDKEENVLIKKELKLIIERLESSITEA